MKLLIGSTNTGKVHEYGILLADADVEVVGLADVGLADMDVEENGTTFEENAILKAKAYAQASGLAALADDSGICVDALDGRPGLYSARYGGAGLDNAGRRRKLLGELENVPDEKRGAEFACVIAVALPNDETVHLAEGICRGRIAHTESTGISGFGYDPVFIPEGYDRTFADISDDEKNELSHRGRAAQKIIATLNQLAAR